MKREVDEHGNIIIRDVPRYDHVKPGDLPDPYDYQVGTSGLSVNFFRNLRWRIEENGPVLFASVLLLGLISFAVLTYLSFSEPQGEWREGADRNDVEASSRLAQAGTPSSTVQVLSEPEGGTVLVDFDSIGTTPARFQLGGGVYVLSVAFDDDVRRDSVIVLEGESNRMYTFSREPARSHSARPFSDATERSLASPSSGASPTTVASAASQSEPQQFAARSSPTDRAGPAASAASGTVGRRSDVSKPADRASVDRAASSNASEGEAEHDMEAAAEDRPARLEAETAPGTLVVRVKPWGSIFVDGTLHARNTDLRYTVALAPGQHRLRVEHPTLGSREVDVSIEPGGTHELPIDLLSGSE